MKFKDLTLRIYKSLKIKHRNFRRRTPRSRRRWRVEIINENTLARTWSMRLPEMRAWIVGGCLLAALASLVIVVGVFTPVGRLLTGRLPLSLRDQYREMAVRVDSLSKIARVQEAYAGNIVAILTDSVPTELPLKGEAAQGSTANPDSLLPASEAEKRFVQQFDARERFNLSVLSPIAAEGMIFESPTVGEDRHGPVSATYRGTVVAISQNHRGMYTLTIQHPNDFISIYSNLTDIYVDRGQKVATGQRIGRSTIEAPLSFELWRGGTELAPEQYILGEIVSTK